jgi:LPS-assembly lipoprotein
MNVLRTLFLSLLVLALAGCGFQLRGTPNWPSELSPVYVSGLETRDPFYLLLAQSLRSAGIEVLGEPVRGGSEIRILALREQRRVLTVTGDARINEYRLVRRLDSELRLPGASAPLSLGELEVRQTYSFDAAAVLAQETREDELRTVMNRDLVRLLQYRVRAATGGIVVPATDRDGT